MRPLLCIVGLHKLSDHNWGYGFGNLDVFCARCEKRMLSIPIGRFPLPMPEVEEVKS